MGPGISSLPTTGKASRQCGAGGQGAEPWEASHGLPCPGSSPPPLSQPCQEWGTESHPSGSHPTAAPLLGWIPCKQSLRWVGTWYGEGCSQGETWKGPSMPQSLGRSRPSQGFRRNPRLHLIPRGALGHEHLCRVRPALQQGSWASGPPRQSLDIGHQIGVGGPARHFLTRRRQSPLAEAAGVGSLSYTRTPLRWMGVAGHMSWQEGAGRVATCRH